MADRPLGLITVWKENKTDPKYEIMKTGLFGYYQNARDYLDEFARVHGWKPDPLPSLQENSVAYVSGQFRIELNMLQATGIDLSKETYLFLETESETEDGKETKA